jgi:hypothetical protein
VDHDSPIRMPWFLENRATIKVSGVSDLAPVPRRTLFSSVEVAVYVAIFSPPRQTPRWEGPTSLRQIPATKENSRHPGA